MSSTQIDARALRDAFGAFITGVTVVTTTDASGRPIGFTANSFSSVSLDPPLLLVCLARTSRNFETMTTAKGFAVNILAEGQKEVSNTFARPVEDRFASVAWERGPLGAPIFPDAAAWFDCAMHEVVEAGDHVILIGRVVGFANGGHNGLGYARGSYFTPALAAKAINAASESETEVAAVVARDREVLLVEKDGGRLGLPGCPAASADPVRALSRLISSQTGLATEMGFLFSVYEERASGRQHIVYRAAAEEGDPLSGCFFPISDLPYDRLDRPQTADILRRFAAESELGQFAVYVGNETAGRVHRLVQEA